MEDSKLNTPAIIELFGHSKMAGMVTEQVIGASSFIRVEVPKTNKAEGFTRMLNPSAIYAINPCTEEIMMAMANSLNFMPITPWDLPKSLKNELPAGVGMGATPDNEEDDFPDDKFGDDNEQKYDPTAHESHGQFS